MARIVLFFVRQCTYCAKLMPEVAALASEVSDVDIQIFYQGNKADAAKTIGHVPQGVQVWLDPRGKAMRTLAVTQTPFGVAVAADGTVIGTMLVNARKHLDQMVEACRLGRRPDLDLEYRCGRRATFLYAPELARRSEREAMQLTIVTTILAVVSGLWPSPRLEGVTRSM